MEEDQSGEPPLVRQRTDDGKLDASVALREVLSELKSFEAIIQSKLDAAIGCSMRAEELAMSTHQQLDRLQNQVSQVGEIAQKAKRKRTQRIAFVISIGRPIKMATVFSNKRPLETRLCLIAMSLLWLSVLRVRIPSSELLRGAFLHLHLRHPQLPIQHREDSAARLLLAASLRTLGGVTSRFVSGL